MAVVEDLIVRIKTEVDRRVREIPGTLDDITFALGDLALAGGAALAALTAFTAGVAAELQQVERLADGLGASVHETQELQSALGLLGVDATDTADALTTITDRARDAADGMQSFVDDFALVGLGVDDLKDKDPIELLETFANAAGNTADANARTAAAVRIFGDDLGRRLIPLLAQGTQGLDDLRQRAVDAGLVLSEDMVRAGGDFAEQADGLRARLNGLRVAIGARLVPALEPLLDLLTDLADTAAPVILQAVEVGADRLRVVMEALNTPLGKGVALIATGLAGASAVRAAKGLAGIAQAAVPAGSALSRFATSAKAASVSVAPFILVTAALGLAAIETKKAIDGEDSLLTSLGALVGAEDAVSDSTSALGDMLDAAGGFADQLLISIGGLAVDGIDFLASKLTFLQGPLEALSDWIRAWTEAGFSGIIDGIGESFQRAARGFNLATRYLQGDDGVAVALPDGIGARSTTDAGRVADVITTPFTTGTVTLPGTPGSVGLAPGITINAQGLSAQQVVEQVKRQIDAHFRGMYQGGS